MIVNPTHAALYAIDALRTFVGMRRLEARLRMLAHFAMLDGDNE